MLLVKLTHEFVLLLILSIIEVQPVVLSSLLRYGCKQLVLLSKVAEFIVVV